MAQTWQDEDKVDEYVGRVGRLAARAAGEAELVEALPTRVERVLDLGCGDGRLSEVAGALAPSGVFVNLEVVRCATPELQEEFHRRIGKPGGDPEDILAGVDEQLDWLRDAGLTQVDYYWRWRGFALLVGRAPTPG